MSGDFQNAPDIIFDKKWKKNQRKLSKMVKKIDLKTQKKIKKLKKKGYTEEEINIYFGD